MLNFTATTAAQICDVQLQENVSVYHISDIPALHKKGRRQRGKQQQNPLV